MIYRAPPAKNETLRTTKFLRIFSISYVDFRIEFIEVSHLRGGCCWFHAFTCVEPPVKPVREPAVKPGVECAAS